MREEPKIKISNRLIVGFTFYVLFLENSFCFGRNEDEFCRFFSKRKVQVEPSFRIEGMILTKDQESGGIKENEEKRRAERQTD